MNYEEYEQKKTREGSHVCVFGDPKSGKSTLVSKLADDGFILHWFSLDNGHSVLGKLSPTAKKNIRLYVLPDTKNFPIAQATMKRIVGGQRFSLCDMHGQINCSGCTAAKNSFSTVEFDTLGENEIVVIDHLQQIVDSGINLISKGKINSSAKPVGSPLDDTMDDMVFNYDTWRKLQALMCGILSDVQQAKWNSICIAHCLQIETESGEKKVVPLVGTREFSDTVGKYFDHIVHCGITNSAHTFGSSTVYKMNVVTGSRHDIAIEKGAPSLKAFFDGTIGKPAESVQSNAAEMLAKLKGQVKAAEVVKS